MQFDFINHESQKHTEQIHPAIERAHHHATKTLKENAISLNDFDGFYDEKKLEKAREMIKHKEASFATSPNHNEVSKRYSDVFEAIIFEQAGGGAWFGKQTHAIKTSTYDDYFNGSDLILEIEDLKRSFSHLSLSVDVTFGTTTEREKIEKIKRNIDNGTLGQIDYFKSERTHYRGEKSHIPQVIIGVEKDTVIDLANLWIDKGVRTEIADNLNEHPIRRLILSEILLQLYTFRTYAKNTGKLNLVPIYEKDIQLLEEIQREQKPGDTATLRDDKVFTAIRESLKIFKSTE